MWEAVSEVNKCGLGAALRWSSVRKKRISVSIIYKAFKTNKLLTTYNQK